VEAGEIFVPLTGIVDARREAARLGRELGKVSGDLQKSRRKMRNKGFLAQAPQEIIEKEAQRLAELERKEDKLRQLVDALLNQTERME